ncbi:MAG: AAA family ATPase [Deltaproteobacteria bacterium]|nr:AAA family ATPase [Deltaproteobacteria bacterium]
MVDENGKRVFRIHQDGKAGRARPGHAAEATVLSSIATAEFPHLYAVREEMRSWRLLQLDPVGLRKPSPLTADEALLPDGSNLAAVLFRIKTETKTPDVPKGALADIAGEPSEIIPGVMDVDVDRDDASREYRASVSLRDGFEFNTSVISDGTLRVLALLTLLHDPTHRGVVCFEEPENGVHPARLRTLIDHLQRLIPDPTDCNSGVEERLESFRYVRRKPGQWWMEKRFAGLLALLWRTMRWAFPLGRRMSRASVTPSGASTKHGSPPRGGVDGRSDPIHRPTSS